MQRLTRSIACACVLAGCVLQSRSPAQIVQFPYSEGFDSVIVPALPAGWISTQNRSPGANDFTTSAGSARSAPNALLSSNATVAQSVTSPAFDFRGQVPDRISFYTRRSATHMARVVLEASTDNGSTFPAQVGDSLLNTGTSGYVLFAFDIPSLLAGSSAARFRWRVVPDLTGATGTFRIDDVGISVRTLNDLALSGASVIPSSVREDDTICVVARVVNLGQVAAPSFGVNVYLDRNNDSLPQPTELVGNTLHAVPLAPADSAVVRICVGPWPPGGKRTILTVEYPPDQNPLNNRLYLPLLVGYRERSVVVNEIMYAPAGGEPEWIEIVNLRGDTVDMKDWQVSDSFVSSRRPMTVAYLPLVPGGRLVVTKDSAALLDVRPGIPSRVVHMPTFPTLNNSGDAVVISDFTSLAVDSVYYLPGWGGSSGGRSLERVDPLGPSAVQSNWLTSRHPAGATPGNRNSVSRKDHDLALDTLMVSPRFPVRGDSIVAAARVRNPGLHPVSPFFVSLFDDANGDTVPQPVEVLQSVLLSGALAPRDSLDVRFEPFRPGRLEHLLMASVRHGDDEDTLNNVAHRRLLVGVRPGSVVVNEIMYEPVGEPEWVELSNGGSDSVDLRNWELGNRNTSSRYRITSFSTQLPPKENAVVVKDSALLLSRYGRMAGLVIQVPVLPTFLFGNNGDAVVLQDHRGVLMDSVRYARGWGGSGGRSLERIDPLEASNDSTNWSSSVDSLRATPGRENSVGVIDHDMRVVRAPDVVGGPGQNVTIGATVRNSGRRSASDFGVAFFDDRNRDSVGSGDELIGRVHLPHSLARGDSLWASVVWPAPRPGIHVLLVQVQYPPDGRLWNNARLFTGTVASRARAVVINEIMFAPFSGEAEYIELANLDPADVDLHGWSVREGGTSLTPPGGFSLASGARVVHSGEFFVLASDSSIVSRFQYLKGLDGRLVCIARQASLSLSNDGDAVVLLDAAGQTIDSLAYSPAWHNPNLGSHTGRSLEKIRPDLRSTDARSWSTCVLPVGGTPAMANSIATYAVAGSASVLCAPNPFSPDGDGFEDFSILRCELPVGVAQVNITIFDAKGRLIRRLARNEPASASREFVWDGRDEEGQKARMGIYVVLVEGISDGGGDAFAAKGIVVVAGKL